MLYGMNSMDVEVKPYWKLIIDEVGQRYGTGHTPLISLVCCCCQVPRTVHWKSTWLGKQKNSGVNLPLITSGVCTYLNRPKRTMSHSSVLTGMCPWLVLHWGTPFTQLFGQYFWRPRTEHGRTFYAIRDCVWSRLSVAGWYIPPRTYTGTTTAAAAAAYIFYFKP